MPNWTEDLHPECMRLVVKQLLEIDCTQLKIMEGKMKQIIVMMFVGVFLCSGVASADLIAHYSFDGNANDSSSNGLHGTVYGDATLTTDRFGNANSAYNFDGIDDRIESANSNLLRLTEDLTINLWVSLDSYQQRANILRYGGEETSYALGSTNQWLSYWHYGGSPVSPVNYFYSPLNLNEWINVSITRDFSAKTVNYYLNGNLISSSQLAKYPISSSGGPLNFGSWLGESGHCLYFFDGSLDDISIYNHALSSEEVQQLYEPVPEPTTMLLFATGLLGLAGFRRKTRRS